MIRAAAKNHSHVTVVVDPADYPALLQHMEQGASEPAALQFRKHLAWKAFQHTATYDSTVAEWMWNEVGAWPPRKETYRPHRLSPRCCRGRSSSRPGLTALPEHTTRAGDGPAPEMSVPMKLAQGLRYGENPHQAAAFYTDLSLAEHGLGGVATAVSRQPGGVQAPLRGPAAPQLACWPGERPQPGARVPAAAAARGSAQSPSPLRRRSSTTARR